MNDKQRRFAEYYAANPNAAEAARSAGYSEKTARTIGQRLLTKVDIQEYIGKLQEQTTQDRILTVSQIKMFWSDIINDDNEKTADRLKASELLSKAAGMFLPAVIFEKNDECKEDVIIYMPNMLCDEERTITDNKNK